MTRQSTYQLLDIDPSGSKVEMTFRVTQTDKQCHLPETYYTCTRALSKDSRAMHVIVGYMRDLRGPHHATSTI